MGAKFLIGCDPEVFVKKDGQHVTAHGLIPGDKKTPHRVTGGAIQVDGMALEFNIDPVPFNDFEAFNKSVVGVMSQLAKALPEGHSFDVTPSVQFNQDYYDNNVPEDAKELGCDPDFCAYSEDIFEPNPRPDGDSGLRSAAGHIHVGWGADIPTDNAEHLEICRGFIRNLDCYVGIGMLVFDTDKERRKLYGKAGAYRPKSYGVEYRTPSNAWLQSKGQRRFIHQLVTLAIQNMQTKAPLYTICQKYLQNGDNRYDVQNIINSGDRKAALWFLANVIGVPIPEALLSIVDGPKKEASL